VAISAGGVLWQQTYQLAALETKALDIGNLIASGAKDENGQVLPGSATGGVAQWSTPSVGQGAGRLLVSQPGIGMARNFGCVYSMQLCGSSSLENSSLNIAADGSGQMGPFEADQCVTEVGFCGGTYSSTTPWDADWSSENSSVATVPANTNTSTVQVTGVLAGYAGIMAIPLPSSYYDPYTGGSLDCYAQTQQGGVTVADDTPSNISVSPSSYAVGTATSFAITGQNLGTNCPQLTWPFPASYTLYTNTCSNTGVSGSVTASAAGSGDLTFTAEGYGGQGFLPGPGQQQSGPSKATVSATAGCPSSVSLYSSTPLALAAGLNNCPGSNCRNYPTFLTGVGIETIMALAPASGKWTNAQIQETVSATSNTCPASVSACTATGGFQVGVSQAGQYTFGYLIPALPSANSFYDEHVIALSTDVLGAAGLNSCAIVCSQTTLVQNKFLRSEMR
jgi:hypothetical protein